MKICAVTIVRDSEKFIIPHLKMYTGVEKNIVLFCERPIRGGALGHSDKPDHSLELIRTHCPEVEIHTTQIESWGAELFNKALSLGKDYDLVVTFHADVVMEQVEWQKLLAFFREEDYDVYKLNMPKCTINYYRDFSHGARDCLDVEPIAAKPTVHYSKFYEFDGSSYIIDWLTVHHFTGWKGAALEHDWLESDYAKQISKDCWLECPTEIKEMFI
jgi:hypothetical protein